MSYVNAQYDPDGQLHLVPQPHSFWSGAAKGAVFGAILAGVTRPVRRYMLTMLALTFAIIFTIETPSDYWDGVSTPAPEPGDYRFPWYCIALIITFVVWGIYGGIRAWILNRQIYAAGQAPVQRLKARMSGRAIIAVDTTPRPPQSPTGPSRGPVVDTTATDAPVGSNLPAIWVPTYSGPAKPVRRIETGLSGHTIHDHRGVDPEDL